VALVLGRRAFHQAAPAALLPREAFRSDPIMVRHHGGPIHGGREAPLDVSDDSTLSPRKGLLLQIAAHLVAFMVSQVFSPVAMSPGLPGWHIEGD